MATETASEITGVRCDFASVAERDRTIARLEKINGQRREQIRQLAADRDAWAGRTRGLLARVQRLEAVLRFRQGTAEAERYRTALELLRNMLRPECGRPHSLAAKVLGIVEEALSGR